MKWYYIVGIVLNIVASWVCAYKGNLAFEIFFLAMMFVNLVMFLKVMED
jgi:hypothetical protein